VLAVMGIEALIDYFNDIRDSDGLLDFFSNCILFIVVLMLVMFSMFMDIICMPIELIIAIIYGIKKICER
jgi:hypothetical protein